MEFVVKLAAIPNVFTNKCIAFGKLVTDVNETNNRNYITQDCLKNEFDYICKAFCAVLGSQSHLKNV